MLVGLTILSGAMTADAATGATVTPTITPNTGLTNGAAVTFRGERPHGQLDRQHPRVQL